MSISELTNIETKFLGLFEVKTEETEPSDEIIKLNMSRP